MKAKPVLGAHVSVAGGVATAFERAARLGCDTIQIFVKNANQWRAKPLEPAAAAAFREAHAGSAVGVVVAHASYLINLAAADGLVRERSVEALADELARCAKLGVLGLVVHPGAHLGAGEETGIDRVAAALDRVLATLPRAPTRILLENTAGQGTCLGCRLEHLAAIRAHLPAPRRRRIAFCIDTCHAFAAGYPIHQPAGWSSFLATLDSLLGLPSLACIHLNDSLRPFASRRDRHAHIGQGHLGLPTFARLLAEPRLAHIPMILETDPEPDMQGHARDLALLRSLTAPRQPTRDRPPPKKRHRKA